MQPSTGVRLIRANSRSFCRHDVLSSLGECDPRRMPADIWEVDDVAMMDEQQGLLSGKSSLSKAALHDLVVRCARIC